MFDNIGKKIKVLAGICFCVGSGIGVICGLISLGLTNLVFTRKIVFGLLGIVVCPVIMWVLSLMVYGFGQLVDNSDKLVKYYKREIKKNNMVENNQDNLENSEEKDMNL